MIPLVKLVIKLIFDLVTKVDNTFFFVKNADLKFEKYKFEIQIKDLSRY